MVEWIIILILIVFGVFLSYLFINIERHIEFRLSKEGIEILNTRTKLKEIVKWEDVREISLGREYKKTLHITTKSYKEYYGLYHFSLDNLSASAQLRGFTKPKQIRPYAKWRKASTPSS